MPLYKRNEIATKITDTPTAKPRKVDQEFKQWTFAQETYND